VISASGHRRLEIIAIVAVAVLSLALLFRVGVAAFSGQLPVVCVTAIAGYVAADLLSGIVHWIFDTWGSEDTPIIGRAFIAPFREHHVDAESITRHNFIETNGNNCIAVLPMLAGAWLIPVDGGAGIFPLAFVLFLCIGMVATNQIHKWAHSASVPRAVRLLQRWRLILPAVHHSRHHTAPYSTHYCITTGWMNPILSALDFHRRVERIFSGVSRGQTS
jgi:plasmanylethanolamine desaturase